MSKHRDEKHYLSDILESIEAIEIYLENEEEMVQYLK